MRSVRILSILMAVVCAGWGAPAGAVWAQEENKEEKGRLEFDYESLWQQIFQEAGNQVKDPNGVGQDTEEELDLEDPKDWPTMIRGCKEYLKEEPNNYEIYGTLGWLYLQQGRWEKAAQVCEKALTLAPGETEYYLLLGTAYVKLKKFDEALKKAGKALKIDPKNAGVYDLVGMVYFRQGDYEQAKENYKRSLELDPNSFDSRIELGRAYLATGDRAGAVQEFKYLEKHNPLEAGYMYAWIQGYDNPAVGTETKIRIKDYENPECFCAVLTTEPNVIYGNDDLSDLFGQLVIHMTLRFPKTFTGYWNVEGMKGKYSCMLKEREDEEGTHEIPYDVEYSKKLDKVVVICMGGIYTIDPESGERTWVMKIDNGIVLSPRSDRGTRVDERLIVSIHEWIEEEEYERKSYIAGIDLKTRNVKKYETKEISKRSYFVGSDKAAAQMGDDIVWVRFGDKGDISFQEEKGICSDRVLVGGLNGQLIMEHRKDYDELPEDEGIKARYYYEGKEFRMDGYFKGVSRWGELCWTRYENDEERLFWTDERGRIKRAITMGDGSDIGTGWCNRGYWEVYEDGRVRIFTRNEVIEERIDLAKVKREEEILNSK